MEATLWMGGLGVRERAVEGQSCRFNDRTHPHLRLFSSPLLHPSRSRALSPSRFILLAVFRPSIRDSILVLPRRLRSHVRSCDCVGYIQLAVHRCVGCAQRTCKSLRGRVARACKGWSGHFRAASRAERIGWQSKLDARIRLAHL